MIYQVSVASLRRITVSPDALSPHSSYHCCVATAVGSVCVVRAAVRRHAVVDSRGEARCNRPGASISARADTHRHCLANVHLGDQGERNRNRDTRIGFACHRVHARLPLLPLRHVRGIGRGDPCRSAIHCRRDVVRMRVPHRRQHGGRHRRRRRSVTTAKLGLYSRCPDSRTRCVRGCIENLGLYRPIAVIAHQSLCSNVLCATRYASPRGAARRPFDGGCSAIDTSSESAALSTSRGHCASPRMAPPLAERQIRLIGRRNPPRTKTGQRDRPVHRIRRSGA